MKLCIKTVAVYSTIDSESMHVRLADEAVCIGEPSIKKSYLNPVPILAAAEITNADAVHPGAGFLSENPDFASMVAKHKMTFIGPTSEQIKMFGDKLLAKKLKKTLKKAFFLNLILKKTFQKTLITVLKVFSSLKKHCSQGK